MREYGSVKTRILAYFMHLMIRNPPLMSYYQKRNLRFFVIEVYKLKRGLVPALIKVGLVLFAPLKPL